MQSQLMARLFSLHRQVGNETTRQAKFRSWSDEELDRILAKTGGEEGRVISIIQPVLASLTLSQGSTGEFLPALVLNGPDKDLAPIVREHLQAFCEYLEHTGVCIRAAVAEQENSGGELCLGLVRTTYVPEPLLFLGADYCPMELSQRAAQG